MKNSTEFAEFILSQNIEEDEELVSFDVISLFTSIPVKLAMEVVDKSLRESDLWKETSNLAKEQVVDLLDFVLNHSYFTYEGVHYHQIFGCVMGSPKPAISQKNKSWTYWTLCYVSAAIADLVMMHVEEVALSTSPVTPRWWRRYVDDSNVCLKKTEVDIFYQHLSTIDPNIQFTFDRASQNEKGQSISFLDTRVTALSDGSLEVAVDVTHTNKYLDYNSHNPLQHKEAVVRTLLNRAHILPSNASLKSAETKRVAKDLRANGYPDRLLQKCLKVNSRLQRTQERPVDFASILYARGASDRTGRVLRKFNIRTAFKPCQTLSQIFKKPKDRPQDHQRTGIVYKVRSNDSAFTYIGESKSSWSSRAAEHDPGRACNGESAIKQHAESTEHGIHPRNATRNLKLHQETVPRVVALYGGFQRG